MSDRVLVIDDSPLVRSMLSEAFSTAGYDVETACDGASGIALAEKDRPDVVVCDLSMPGLSGFEVVDQLEKRLPLTPILIFSESADVTPAVNLMQRGAFSYLVKGMSDDVVLEELRRALMHRRMLVRNQDLEAANKRYQKQLETMVDEKTREIARLESARAQEEKLAAMGSMVAGIAHEVNNPLAVVKSNSRFLAEEVPQALMPTHPELAAEAAQALKEVDTCTVRIHTIVESLRRLAYTGGKQASSDVTSALDEVKLLCRNRIPVDVDIRWHLAPGVDRVALAQEDVVTVFTNLLVNGWHAIEKAATIGRLTVRGWVFDGRAYFEVEDNGIGIPPEHLTQVCNPFFTTKPPGKGTGLGLSLVYQVVKNAGGHLTIESKVGEGTTVAFDVPVEAPQRRAPPPEARK